MISFRLKWTACVLPRTGMRPTEDRHASYRGQTFVLPRTAMHPTEDRHVSYRGQAFVLPRTAMRPTEDRHASYPELLLLREAPRVVARGRLSDEADDADGRPVVAQHLGDLTDAVAVLGEDHDAGGAVASI